MYRDENDISDISKNVW